MGGNANCKCCRCQAGGDHKHTESNDGYYALHFVSHTPQFYVNNRGV